MTTWLRLALTALLALFATPAFAQTFPQFTGLVVDDAHVLPADRKAALEQKLEAFQQRTGRQLVVATIADTQGYPLEDYGYRLGRAWGVGLKDADNGAILFIAPNQPAGQRGPRLEVGRKLEPVLTDALSNQIARVQMVPILRSGDIPGALDAGVDSIIAQLSLPDDQARAEAAKAAQAFDKAHQRSASGGFPLGLIFLAMVVGFVLLAMSRRKAGGRRYRQDGGGSDWPIWLWAASEFLDSNHRGGGGSSGWGGGGGGSSGGGGSDGSWGGGGFTGGGGGDFGGGGASGDW